MSKTQFRKFNSQENETWKVLFDNQAKLRDLQIIPEFSAGIKYLELTNLGVPDLERVNRRLLDKTGWRGVAVEGFEEFDEFYEMLYQREFPIGNFIRDRKDLSYTPAPDVFHDLYGHLPFYVDDSYADFSFEFAKRVRKYKGQKKIVREFERLFWFTMEFALIETREGRRIFGAGIASSHKECAYALSNEPEVVPFDIEVVRNQEFQIDILQPRLFCLKSAEQLYTCLDAFERPYLK